MERVEEADEEFHGQEDGRQGGDNNHEERKE
jgi:hypothetical protein